MTLVEVLVAMGIFAIVLAASSAGIVQALRLQALNETNASLQGKLRRISEVVAQDLRSAVFGSLMTQPYTTGATSLSFALADGGAGYTVLPTGGASFPNRNNVDVVVPVATAADTGLQGSRALMVNSVGQAIEFEVTNVAAVGGAGSQRFNVVHAGCNNVIAYEQPVTLTRIQTQGFSFDAASGELRWRQTGGTERVVAFGLSDFRIDYVYERDDGTLLVHDAPLLDSGRPVRRGLVGGAPHILTALRVTIAAEEPISGRTVQRSYVSQIALPAGGAIQPRTVVSCP